VPLVGTDPCPAHQKTRPLAGLFEAFQSGLDVSQAACELLGGGRSCGAPIQRV
jgi:hypothetical protein